MALNIAKTLSFPLLILYSIIQLSDQSVYPYSQAVSKTLSELDLNSLEGHWYGVYHRNAKGEDSYCPQLDVVVGNGSVNVTESIGNETTFEQKMEQNQYLKGKISQVIHLPAGYSVERPWFITQIDPVLVVYQVTTGNRTEDNWSVYSRNRTSDTAIVELGAQRLVEAGAVADQSGKVGYHCSD